MQTERLISSGLKLKAELHNAQAELKRFSGKLREVKQAHTVLESKLQDPDRLSKLEELDHLLKTRTEKKVYLKLEGDTFILKKSPHFRFWGVRHRNPMAVERINKLIGVNPELVAGKKIDRQWLADEVSATYAKALVEDNQIKKLINELNVIKPVVVSEYSYWKGRVEGTKKSYKNFSKSYPVLAAHVNIIRELKFSTLPANISSSQP